VELTVVTEEFPPFNYMAANGTVTGRSTAVVNEIIDLLGRDDRILVKGWADAYALATTRPHVVIFSIGRTAEREPLFSWVGPIGSYTYVFYGRTGSGITVNSLDDAKAAGTIAVVRDDARHQFLVERNVTGLSLYATDADCYRALVRGEADLVLGSRETMEAACREGGVDPAHVEALYTVREVPLYIAFSEGTPPAEVDRWRETLGAMKRDGTYDAILARWGTVTPSATVPGSTGVTVPAGSAARLMAGFVDARLDTVLAPLETIAVTEAAQSGSWERIKPLLVAREAADPAARYWYVLPDGSYYTTVDDLASGNLRERSYFPGLMAGGRVTGTLVISKSTGRNVAVVAAPITTGSAVTGGLGASIYLSTISGELEEAFPLPADSLFLAVTPGGVITLHPDPAWIDQPVTAVSGDLAAVGADPSGEVAFATGGRMYTGVWSTAPVSGWRCMVAVPADG